jgi:diguanylate cyclase (GGDEF)-like protein
MRCHARIARDGSDGEAGGMIRSDRGLPGLRPAWATFAQHRGILLLTALLLAFVTSSYLGAGVLKAASAVKVVDVVGEGLTAVFVAVWLGILLAGRPPGRVTQLLAAGLVCFLLGFHLDLLDEFVALPEHLWWDDVIESGAPALGLVVTTLALLQFAAEQRVLARQLARREGRFREHRSVDRVTQLYDAGYLREHLAGELASGRRPLLVAVDLDGFGPLNRRLGPVAGDRLLALVGELLLLAVDDEDLVCRYAGDRFVCVLHGADAAAPALLAEAFNRVLAGLSSARGVTGPDEAPLSASFGWTVARAGEPPEALVTRANADLEARRRRQETSA